MCIHSLGVFQVASLVCCVSAKGSVVTSYWLVNHHSTEIVCGSLSSPDNGNVIVSGTGLGAEATYTCDTGYDMEGQNMRTCMNSADPQWSGSAPVCNSK